MIAHACAWGGRVGGGGPPGFRGWVGVKCDEIAKLVTFDSSASRRGARLGLTDAAAMPEQYPFSPESAPHTQTSPLSVNARVELLPPPTASISSGAMFDAPGTS